MLFLSNIFFSCKRYFKENVQIKGNIQNIPSNTYALLYHALPTAPLLIDSTKLDKDGSFILKTHISEKDFYYLTFTGNNYNIYLVLDSGQTITIQADYKDLLNTYNVEGSYESSLIQLLEQQFSYTRRKLDSLATLYNQYISENIQDSAEIVNIEIKRVMSAQKKFSRDFVLKHKNSLVVLPALSQVYVKGKSVFTPEEDEKIYFLVDSILSIYYPHNSHVLRLHTFVQNIKLNKLRNRNIHNFIEPGIIAPDFEAKTMDGKVFRLSEQAGKKVYIVFLASWCEECIKFLQKDIDTNNVVKVAIMLDIDQDKAQEFAQKYLQSFTVICDKKFWNSQIVKRYNILELPRGILISKDGTILEVRK